MRIYSTRRPDTPDQKKTPEDPISKIPNAHTTYIPPSRKVPTTTLTRTQKFLCDDDPPRENTALLWGDPDGQAQLETGIAVLPE